LVTLKSYYRKRRRLINDAEQHNVSVYVLRANTVSQMERFLGEALGLEVALRPTLLSQPLPKPSGRSPSFGPGSPVWT
jgi:hypothetical protein